MARIKITDDQINEIVIAELKESIDSLERYLRDYEEDGNKWIAVFDTDPKQDVKKIKKHLKSFRRVLGWYTVPGYK